MVKITEEYKKRALIYYIEHVEIPQVEETIDFYEGLAQQEPKYIENHLQEKQTLEEWKEVLEELQIK